eukprot:6213106-Pleurochrysis_carterae.AAC.2
MRVSTCRVGVGCHQTWVFERQLQFNPPLVVRVMCTACAIGCEHVLVLQCRTQVQLTLPQSQCKVQEP